MRIEDHWNKAMRLEATRKKLERSEDYEVVVWSCIHGGAQLANIVLHRLGVTDESFDLIHSNVPEHNLQLPAAAADMLATLKSIEDLGPRFVRGIEPLDARAVQGCVAAYDKVRALAEKLLNGKGEAA